MFRWATILSIYYLVSSLYQLVSREYIRNVGLRFTEKQLRDFTEMSAGSSYDQIVVKACRRLLNQSADSQVSALFHKGTVIGRSTLIHLSLFESLTILDLPFGGQISIPMTSASSLTAFSHLSRSTSSNDSTNNSSSSYDNYATSTTKSSSSHRMYIINGKMQLSHMNTRQITNLNESNSRIPRGSIIQIEPGTIVMLHQAGDVVLSNLRQYIVSVFNVADIHGSLIVFFKTLIAFLYELPQDFRNVCNAIMKKF